MASAMTSSRRSDKPQPWLGSARVDTALILLPPFLAVAFVLAFRDAFDGTTAIPLWAWVGFILCIDVAHVYSTVFRTYLNPREFNRRRVLFTAVPILCWVGGALLYSFEPTLFWRVLAYVAVYHFVRQQYGFMALYARRDDERYARWRWIDKGTIYLATLYPLAYWHTHLPRNFYWLIDGDFIARLPAGVDVAVLIAYLAFACAYVLKETMQFRASGYFNIPKQAIVVGTAVSWYVGIVLLNGDIAFTVINVVSHGIPYIGLIWLYGRKQPAVGADRAWLPRLRSGAIFSLKWAPVFVGVLLLFAYIEEGLWHGLVWRERLEIFPGFAALPKIDDQLLLACLIPLLALPQLTHYVLDGFIWRMKGPESTWRRILFRERRGAGTDAPLAGAAAVRSSSG